MFVARTILRVIVFVFQSSKFEAQFYDFCYFDEQDCVPAFIQPAFPTRSDHIEIDILIQIQ